ncbi:MAG TPA: hypothetical protein VK964_04125 [Nocardioidaceae bacterium]|nr:hypothetical protein [Nocardioidaceae bacterium]
MTAQSESTTAVVDDGGIEGDGRPEGPPQSEAGAGRRAVQRRVAPVMLLAVLIPLALLTWRAMHAPINFDGGMNLQVARRLANGEGYTRFYEELSVFPHEVQTNGPYIYLAAAGIKLFGANQFAYQFSNLVFVAAFSITVSLLLLRESAVVRIVGPFVVLLTVPLIPIYGLGGLGEIPTSFFLFAAILALVEAVRSPKRSPQWVLGASVAFGAAVATKTFAVGAAGVVAMGLVCVVLAAPSRRVRWQVVLAAGGVAVVPVVREAHRLWTLGSLGGYRAWWADQSDSVTAQSGLDGAGGDGPVQTFLDHMHVLARLADFPAELLLVVLFLPLAWVCGLVVWRCREQGVRTALADPTTVLVLLVGVMAASYILWWMLLLPDNKLWIRRIMPGVLALHLLYLLLVPWLIRGVRDALRRSRGDAITSSLGRVPVIGAVAALLVIAATALPYGWQKVEGNTRATLDDPGQQAWLDATEAAAEYVQENGQHRYYGDEWWSAPVVSLMSGTDFHNLGVTDFCSFDPARDRLVWDYDAKRIRSHDPWTRDGKLVYDEVASFGDFVTIYSVGPAPGRCD